MKRNAPHPKMTKYFKRDSALHGPRHQLKCCLCGEENRKKFKVEDLGLAVGMSGDDYTFCRKCWNAKDLGKNILRLLGHPRGLKLLDSMVDKKTVATIKNTNGCEVRK